MCCQKLNWIESVHIRLQWELGVGLMDERSILGWARHCFLRPHFQTGCGTHTTIYPNSTKCVSLGLEPSGVEANR